jgi:hypothetical protein
MAEDRIFQQLVVFAKSEYKDGLNILFVNHRLLPQFKVIPDETVLGLIEVRGEVEEAEKSISLAKSKFSVNVFPWFFQNLSIIRDLIYSLLKQLENLAVELKPEIQPELINRFITEPISLTEPVSFSDKTLLEGIIAILLEYLISLWRKQCKDIKNVEQLIEHLSRYGLIEPWLQVNVCTKCHGFGIISGSYPIGSTTCFKCNVQSTYARVYLFNKDFNQHKMRDKDLPLFISYYLQNILRSSSISVKSFKWFGSDTEIDVSVEDYTGIECKTYLREAPAGEEYIKSKSGELFDQLKKYHKVGIKRVIVVTSLPPEDSRHLEKDLMKKLENENIKFESLNVVPGIIDELIRTLDKEAEEILKRWSKYKQG